jgi:hypothetical protein
MLPTNNFVIRLAGADASQRQPGILPILIDPEPNGSHFIALDFA